MIWIILYIITAILIYKFAYRIIKKIDKKEREKLNAWEYKTLTEIRELVNDICSDIPNKELWTLGALEEYVHEREKEIEKKWWHFILFQYL